MSSGRWVGWRGGRGDGGCSPRRVVVFGVELGGFRECNNFMMDNGFDDPRDWYMGCGRRVDRIDDERLTGRFVGGGVDSGDELSDGARVGDTIVDGVEQLFLGLTYVDASAFASVNRIFGESGRDEMSRDSV